MENKNMSFTKLKILDREEIPSCIHEFLINNKECDTQVKMEEMNGGLHRYYFSINHIDHYLDVYFLNNGTTTIQPASGDEIELKIELAQYIKNKLTNDAIHQGSFSIKHVNKDDIETIITLIVNGDEQLVKIKEFKKIPEDPATSNKCFNYKITGIQGDKVALIYYNSGTLMMQGSPIRLFKEMMSVLTSYLTNDEQTVAVYNDTYRENIDLDEVEAEFRAIVPHYKRINKTLRIVMEQAVYNTKIKGEMFDYTGLLFPALRALEGQIKYVAQDYNLTIPKKYGVGGLFNKYNNSLREHINNKKVEEYLVKLYRIYSQQRNTYFHWQTPKGTLDSTHLINKRDEAVNQIKEILKNINFYYDEIKNYN